MTDIEAIIAACEKWADDYEREAAQALGKRSSPTYVKSRVIAYRNIATMIRDRDYWRLLDMDDPQAGGPTDGDRLLAANLGKVHRELTQALGELPTDALHSNVLQDILEAMKSIRTAHEKLLLLAE